MDRDYLAWFWATPGGRPHLMYNAKDNTRYAVGSAWSLQGLALPPALLPAAQRASLLRFFDAAKRSELPFLVPGLTRFPNTDLVVRGLWQYGRRGDADALAEAALRDVIRAGEFAEFYAQENPPRPDGVRPSTFGAAHVITWTLWRSGVDVGNGRPVLVRVPGAAGVALRVRNQNVDLHP